MRQAAKALALAAAALALLAAPAHAEFGFKDLRLTFTEEGGAAASQAGSHPFALTNFLAFNTVFDPELGESGAETPEGGLRELTVDFPPGLVANPTATPRCTGLEFAEFNCPDASAVGAVSVVLNTETVEAPVYNLVPTPGSLGKLGFFLLGAPVTIELGLSEKAPYHGTARLTGVSQIAHVYSSELTVWGNPSDPAHDHERGKCLESKQACPAAGGSGKPFITLPRSCQGPLTTLFHANSWQDPATLVSGEATTPDPSQVGAPAGMTGCGKLGFAPQIAARPTTSQAASQSGLGFELKVEDEGLLNPDQNARSDIKKTVVTLPEGMTINAAQAAGLGVCTEAQLAAETSSSPFGAGCPASSKIGDVEVETPLLEGQLLRGSLFVAAPFENRFGSLIALYMTVKSPELGISAALAGKVEADPATGRLVSTFDDLPQVPFSSFRLHFRGGPRAPLVTPPRCGTYQIAAELTPWANPANSVTTSASFTVDSGPGGGPCPSSDPFSPQLEAGSIDNSAGAFSPFYMRLTRGEGEAPITRLSALLPPGLTGKIAGVGRCSDAALAVAAAKSGRAELAAPSCPAASQVGRLLAGAGVGPDLTYVPGRLYLAGPFGGDPLSLAAVVPAVAGPFDIGTVVTRVGLNVDPVTAQVRVDGSASDPIPTILSGIPLQLRDLRIYTDRNRFTINPTSCAPTKTAATLFSGGLAASLADRYQAASCASLGFKPKLTFLMKGGHKRRGFPALRAVLTPRPGDANFGKAVITLPHSVFLEQGHIRTICTRVQYAAGTCPAGSVYGHVRATTPLLDEPLEGPVYLRASNHPLPDLVFALHGIFNVEVSARIDSVGNGRLRTTIESAPDVPVTKFVLQMQGGRKGLVVNSRNLCAHRSRVAATMTGQNGRRYKAHPALRATCHKHKRRR